MRRKLGSPPRHKARQPALLIAGSLAVFLIAVVPARAAPFVYVTNTSSDTVSQYDVGTGGLLAPLLPPTVGAGGRPVAIAASPDGGSVYVTNVDHAISQYDVDAGGALQPKSPATVAGGGGKVAVSPDGGSVYVTNVDPGGGSVFQYDVGAGGALQPKSPATVAAGDGPSAVAVSPDGGSVYVTNIGYRGASNSVLQYDVGAGGTLQPKSPATVAAGDGPNGVAVSPDGGSAYVTDFYDDTVSQYDVGAGGALQPKSPATVAAGDGPRGVVVRPGGASVYVTNVFGDTVSQYDVGAGGALQAKGPATVAAGESPNDVAVSPDGGSLYVPNAFGDTVSQYDVGPGGRLSPKSPPTVAAGSFPGAVAVSPAEATANRRPSCAGVHVDPGTLLPATGVLNTVALTGATDPGDTLSYHIDGVVQDEPVSGEGVGDQTFPDARLTAAGADSNLVRLRAERSPDRDGRVYRIAYSVSDGHGGRCSRTAADTNATVSVPRESGEPAVDNYDRGEIQRFDSFTGRELTEGRDRFAGITGPLKDAVIFPDEFGVDVSDLSVDVPSLTGAVDEARLRADVAAIAKPRAGDSQGALAAADYVAGRLEAAGYAARQKVISPGRAAPNVFADRAGTVCPGREFVVGAHYDSVGNAGADDNASGVAGMLEVARVLRNTRLPISVRYASFGREEENLDGSRAMAADLKAHGADLAGMVSLEMIGFTSQTTDSFLGTTNDYLAMIGDPRSASLARVFGAAAYEYLPHFFAPASVIDPATLPDITRSDHASFWHEGYPALLVTDTANFRNPNYHRATDTIDTLDFGFLADSTRATIAGLVALATIDADHDRRPDVCKTDDLQTAITGGPIKATNDPTPTFAFSASEAGSSFQCRLDGGAYSPCTSPQTTPHLADGRHTFYVRARDSEGNVDPTPARRSFTVRTAAVGVSGSTLVVTAASGAKDNLVITKPSATTLRVTDFPGGADTGSGLHAGSLCSRSGDYTASCGGFIDRVQITAADETDRVANSTAVQSLLYGGSGRDTLQGGSSGDLVKGGPGADLIKGMDGSDLLLARDLVSDQTVDCDGGTTAGSADRADLDLFPKDPNAVVKGCETKRRY